MNFINSNKVVIVTGAGNGIGAGVAKAYAKTGANVIIAEKDLASGTEIEKQLKTAGHSAIFIETDVSNPTDIESLMQNVSDIYGKIDILINNAGIGMWKSPYDVTLEDWDKIINTNLRSAFLCSREAAQVMKKHKKGSIVNMASTRAFMSEPHSELYAASKGGIIALTHALSASLAPDNIQVNCISPGWIQTVNYDEIRDIDHAQHFSNRVGKVEDIAKACLYLTQDGNEFINAQNITIDGGMTKKMIYEDE